ncbi:MAG: lipopolysaccharide biosynthesis protein [Mariniphaga sp.]
MSNQSLKSKAAKGMAWSAFGTFAVQGISFSIGIILARILMPSDYGLVGMLTLFFAISQLFVESGFSSALVQKINRTEEDYSTIFYFNLFVSVIFYSILFFIAPLIASFYNTPELILLTRVLSLNILVGSLTIVQQARLNIKLDFKTPALISIFSVIISGTLGVYLAYHGFGVWALVYQGLSASIVRAILLFILNKWLPMLTFSFSSLKQLFGFSSKLLAAGFVATIVNNLYFFLIGRIFSSKDLGFYTRAKQFPELLSGTISSILQGVTYPILSSLQNERERMVSVYGKLMRVTVFFVMPLLTLFALLAEPFIRLFLTEKWMPVVPLIQWLCFARMITPISALNMNILNAIGRSDLFFKVDISKLPLTVTTLVITVPFGLKAVVIGHFITSFICFFVNAYFPGKMFGFGAIRQIKEMKAVIIATLIMSLSVFGINKFISNDFLQLVAGTVFGLMAYLLVSYLLKIEELNELKRMGIQIIGRIRNQN